MEPELERLRIRVDELERRLAAVEGRVGMAAVVAPPPVPPPLVVPPPVFVPPPPVVVSEADRVETNAGLVWANRIGAVTMILGVAFAFLYAVDNEMIGPTGRVICGLVAAMVALLAGDKLWQRGHQVFAQGITALGICILYFSFYAAYQLYYLIPQALAFGGAVVTTALGGALALRYDARTVAILALFGGYLSPFLASSGVPNDLFLGSYLAALNGVALTLARRKSWVSVDVMAAIATVFLVSVWFAERRTQMSPLFAGFAVAQFVIFVSSPFVLIRLGAPVVGMFAVGWMCSPESSPIYWAWAGVVSLVGMGLAWRERDDQRLAASMVGWMVGFAEWNPQGASHGSLFGGLVGGFVSYLGVVVFLPTVRRTMGTYSTMALNAVFFYGVCYGWFHREYAGYMGLLALVVAASFLGVATYLKGSGAPTEMVLVSAGWALGFVTLAIPIQMSGYSITLAWAVECAVLAFLAMRLQNRWAFAASWIVGVLAVGMVFGSDAGRAWGAEYLPVMNARFVPFVVVAWGLAANAYWTSKVGFLPRAMAGAPLVAAHFVMLAGLHLEAFAWIGSGDSKMAFASSLLLALYGLALMAQGMARNFRLHRVLGLGLFALVVLKLYLYDIWQLDRFYRILAFVVLGALLLSGSFLYSRYRHRLLELLQHDEEA
ncbi:MAG: DUF2339 domain-containing protein [Acidobacteria bacterium]|nr:DUF2339 domain-containing protein [Acidobacteriota bacterium]